MCLESAAARHSARCGPRALPKTAWRAPVAGTRIAVANAAAAGVGKRTEDSSPMGGTTWWLSYTEMVCDKMERSSPGAQTERRGDAGPVRDLLGGKAAPAVSL